MIDKQLKQLKVLVSELINQGNNPNKIIEEIENVIAEQGDYALFGDGRWRLDTVCSVCGSEWPGLCKHNHKVIPRKDWDNK
ncbi:hypothetical protein ES708_33249 [subsurface metagenome]